MQDTSADCGVAESAGLDPRIAGLVTKVTELGCGTEETVTKLIEQLGVDRVDAHYAEVERAKSKYEKVVEKLTPWGSIICRPPTEDKAQAYFQYTDGMVDVGLKRESASAVSFKLVEACRLVPKTRKELEDIFRHRPGLQNDISRQLATLAGNDDAASIAGN